MQIWKSYDHIASYENNVLKIPHEETFQFLSYVKVCLQTFKNNRICQQLAYFLMNLQNSRVRRIKNAKFSRYCFHMNTNIYGDFQICISVPLRAKFVRRLQLIYYVQIKLTQMLLSQMPNFTLKVISTLHLDEIVTKMVEGNHFYMGRFNSKNIVYLR